MICLQPVCFIQMKKTPGFPQDCIFMVGSRVQNHLFIEFLEKIFPAGSEKVQEHSGFETEGSVFDIRLF
jgi:hypothetical protein